MQPPVDRADRQQPAPRSALMRSLSREWQRLRRDPDALAAARRWSAKDPHLQRMLDELTDLDHLVNDTACARPDGDALLRVLLAAAAHDGLAARVVLTRIAPLAIARAAQFGCSDERGGVVDLVVPALWMAITEFDPARRPTSLANALAADAVYFAFRREHRRTGGRERPASLSVVAEPTAPPLAPTLGDDLHSVLADARAGGVADEYLDLLNAVAAADSIKELARAENVTTRTIRNRRRRAVEEVRAAIAA
ncbi:MAG: hypothetical protein AAGF73_10640 [Actinomycetota bacterium]